MHVFTLEAAQSLQVTLSQVPPRLDGLSSPIRRDRNVRCSLPHGGNQGVRRAMPGTGGGIMTHDAGVRDLGSCAFFGLLQLSFGRGLGDVLSAKGFAPVSPPVTKKRRGFPGQTQPLASQVPSPPSGSFILTLAFIPVSYTHLTLPTICSV